MPGLLRTRSRAGEPPVAGVPDEVTLVALAKRDRQAFAPLYHRYFELVYRYCYRRLGTREAAADATSQVFANALAKIGGCRDESFRSWLFAIAHNVVTDTYRTAHPAEALETALEIEDPGPDPELLALAAEEQRLVQTLLAGLPEAQRQVAELRLAGLNGSEIGQVLGRSRSWVDTTQFRAVAGMRKLLGIAVNPKESGDAVR
jgi:RNA polymerase sigma-70 factor (ECF subfamily)